MFEDAVHIDAIGIGDQLATAGRHRIIGDVYAFAQRVVGLVGVEVITQRGVERGIIKPHAAVGPLAKLGAGAGKLAGLDVEHAGRAGQRRGTLTDAAADEHIL